jgi:inner membrane protein
MPTIFSHAAVPLALATGLGRFAVSSRLLAAGAIASMLPDIDVLAFHFGVPYGAPFGHRGATHSLAFALVVGLIALAAAGPLKTSRRAAFAFVTASAASHGLLDMLTNGGSGIALLWPFSDERFFFPWQLIEVSPLGLRFFASARAVDVLSSEILWVWLPAVTLCGFVRLLRFSRDADTRKAKLLVLGLIAALSFLFAALERALTGDIDAFSNFGLAEALASVSLLFWWFHLDKAERDYGGSGLLNVAIVAFGPFALLWYFFRSRGLRGGSVATLACIGYMAALFALAALGETAAAHLSG